MGASVGIGGLIVGTSMMVVFALAITTLDLRMESSLETLDSANDPLPSFVIENADFWEGAIIDVNIVDAGAGYVDGTLSTTGPGGFAASFTVDPVTGEIDSVTVTSHGNYSSTPPLPDIQVDGQPGVATPADASLMMQLGSETVFVGSGIFMSDDPSPRAKAIVDAVTYYKDPKKMVEISTDLQTAMKGIEISEIPENERLQERGW